MFSWRNRQKQKLNDRKRHRYFLITYNCSTTSNGGIQTGMMFWETTDNRYFNEEYVKKYLKMKFVHYLKEMTMTNVIELSKQDYISCSKTGVKYP